MAIYKRGEIWWASFTTPHGQRIRESTGTADRKAAQEYHDKLKAECWRVYQLGDKPRRPWQEAVIRWLKETEHKASHRDDVYHLRVLNPFLKDKYLQDINRDLLDFIIQQRKAKGVTNATVNRSLALVRSILRRAEREWLWLDKAPIVKLLPGPKQRIRWLTKEEAEKLLAELPMHLADMARFSLATGLRESNVTGLEWSQVDLERRCAWIHPDQAKARKAIAIPLNAEAILVLRKQLGKHLVRVFTYQGQSIKATSTRAWRLALERVGVSNFRWHDLRHTWATWHVQSGTPLHVLQELGGWSSYEMVRRYAHLSADHLAHYADRLSALRLVDTNLAQSEIRKMS